jgi:hypothetical protein
MCRRSTAHRYRASACTSGAQGFYAFGSLSALENSNPDFFIQSFGDFDTNLGEVRFAGFAQDHWTVSQALNFDLGVRYDYNRLPSSFHQDLLNLSPRLGLAWTPLKTVVVRSGFGIFYDRFELATVNRISEFDGTHGFEQIAEDSSAANLYRSGRTLSGPMTGVAPSVWNAQSNLLNPYSEVGSLSVEKQLPWQTTLAGEYQFVHGVHLGRSSNVNLAPPVILTSTNGSTVGISSPTAQQLGHLVLPERASIMPMTR